MSELTTKLSQFRASKRALTDCKNASIGACDVKLLMRYGRHKEACIDIGPSEMDPNYREVYIKNGQVKAFKSDKVRPMTDDERKFMPKWVERLQKNAQNA